MKGRQLNKLYQLMRISRFFELHKEKLVASALRKSIKGFNDHIDDVLVLALKQKNDITHVTKQKAEKREEMVRATLHVASLAGIYYLQNKNVIKQCHTGRNYTYYKMQSEVVVANRCKYIIEVVKDDVEFLKPYGIREKDVQRIATLAKEYEALQNMPRLLLVDKATKTSSIKEGLKELDTLQRKTLDSIAKCFFNTGILKSEYAKARKIVHHKNPEVLFDEMLKKYRGVRKKTTIRSAGLIKGKTLVVNSTRGNDKLRLQVAVLK